MNPAPKDVARENLEDAVYRALEAGMTEDDIKSEVAYALETAKEDS